MANSKKFYFIPIIAAALKHDDPKRAMHQAFDEIQELGKQPEYKEGFLGFQKFAKASLRPPGEHPEKGIQMVRDAIHRLMYDLATGTFQGDEEQAASFIRALRSHPEWNAEYERIKAEAREFLDPEAPIEVEVIKEKETIGSMPISSLPACVSSINPASYTIRLSNGRVLWEGELTREEVIWTFAFPAKDLAMAAKTEPQQREPTKTVSLLGGELVMYVFAGLEAGEIRIESLKVI
jgi:hypothetical protein